MQSTDDFTDALAVVLKLSPVDKVRLMEQVMATLRDDLQPKTAKPSLLGMWADVSVSEVEIDSVRDELWDNFGRDDI